MALPTEATKLRFSGLPDKLLPQEPSHPLVVEAFHCRLKGPVLVDKKTLVELQGFQTVSGTWAKVVLSSLGLLNQGDGL